MNLYLFSGVTVQNTSLQFSLLALLYKKSLSTLTNEYIVDATHMMRAFSDL